MNFSNNLEILKMAFEQVGVLWSILKFHLFKDSLKVKEISRGTSFKSWNSGLFAHTHVHACTRTIHSWPGATVTSSPPGTPIYKQEESGRSETWSKPPIFAKNPLHLGAPLSIQSSQLSSQWRPILIMTLNNPQKLEAIPFWQSKSRDELTIGG